MKVKSFRNAKWWLLPWATGWLALGEVAVSGVKPASPAGPPGAARVSPAPACSVPGGAYTNDFTLALTAASGASSIHYTLDGSEPVEASPVYSAPLRVTNSVFVRARVIEKDVTPGEIVAQSYTLLDADVAGFSSNLPLIILSTFGKAVTKAEKTFVAARFIDNQGGRSLLSGVADLDVSGVMNVRGNTSLRYPKHSYHLKTRAADGGTAKVSPLGFPKDSDWVLYAPYPDKTMMRDVLAYELSNQMGRYASRTKFVEVFVSEGGGKVNKNDYVGVYVLEEKIKRSPERVNIAKLTPENNAEPDISGGYIFKKDHLERSEMTVSNPLLGTPVFRNTGSSSRIGFPTGPGGFPARREGFLPGYTGSTTARSTTGGTTSFRSPVNSRGPLLREAIPNPAPPPRMMVEEPFEFANGEGFTTRRTNHFCYVEPKADEITAPQKKWLTDYVNRFESALYGPNFRDPAKGYAAFIDVDSFIDQHLLVELTKNVDGFRFSTYFQKDRNGKIKLEPIWDWNLSFGNCNGKQGWRTDTWYWPQLDDQQYSWFRRLFQDPDFAQRYVDRWGQLRTNVFAATNLLARVDRYAALLNEAQARNYERWPILGKTVWPQWFVGVTYEQDVNWLKLWAEKRLAWVDEQLLAAPSFSLKEGRVASGSTLALEIQAGKIYYTVDGSDPRRPGGGVAPQARLYNAPLTLHADARVVARVAQDGLWSWPAAGKFTVGP